jgi:hypothetical protein
MSPHFLATPPPTPYLSPNSLTRCGGPERTTGNCVTSEPDEEKFQHFKKEFDNETTRIMVAVDRSSKIYTGTYLSLRNF